MKANIKNFDIEHWASGKSADAQVAHIVHELASRHIDITQGYDEWLRLGFALADGLGEAGRPHFHELSRQNSGYNHAECDRQYSACLASHKGGVSIATFFHMAREAGVDIKENRFYNKTISYEPTRTDKPTTDKKELKKSETLINKGFSKNNTSEPTLVGLSVRVGKIKTGYTFSDKIDQGSLTPFLQEIANLNTSVVDCDKMLLGALNVVSGLLGGTNEGPGGRPGIFAIYDRRRVYAPLFNIIFGPAGSAKGDLVFCKLLAQPVRIEMRRRYEEEKSQWQADLAAWEAQGKGRQKSLADRGPAPREPAYRDPFVAGNSSSSAVYRSLEANHGWGMMFETEADTISSMLASDYGNYSDLLRRSFHHESLSMTRATEKLHINIDEPRLSVLLTCTPGQLGALFPSFENGLGSRFLFYGLPEEEACFHDVFSMTGTSLEDIYRSLGEDLLPLYHALVARSAHPLQFALSDRQQQEFMAHFSEILGEQWTMLGADIKAFVFRLALSCFRYAMVLTLLRRLDKWRTSGRRHVEGIFLDDEQAVVCEDVDFDVALRIIDSLVNHTARVYAVMAKENENPFALRGINLCGLERDLYEAIPYGEIRTVEIREIASAMGLYQRKTERILSKMVNAYKILLPGHTRGYYIKPSPEAWQPSSEGDSTSESKSTGSDTQNQ